MTFRALALATLVAATALAGCLGGGSKETPQASEDGSVPDDEDVINSLEGFVTSTELVPLPGATVILGSTNASRSTNVHGGFRYVNLAQGDHLVTVTHEGYRALSQRASVRDGFTTLLNFTLEAVSRATAHNETLDFRGVVSCYAFVGSDPETGTHQDCGEVDPQNKPSNEFEFDPGGAQVQIEAFWQPGTALAAHLTIRVESVAFGHQDVVFAYQTGAPGMKVVIGPANMEKYYPNGGRIRVTMMAGASVTGDEAETDVGVALEQTFDIAFTIFYVEPGPEGFSTRA